MCVFPRHNFQLIYVEMINKKGLMISEDNLISNNWFSYFCIPLNHDNMIEVVLSNTKYHVGIYKQNTPFEFLGVCCDFTKVVL